MRAIFLLSLVISLIPFTSQADHEVGPLLFQDRYYLMANENYATELRYVYNYPVTTRNVLVKYSGRDCDIRMDGLEYTHPAHGQAFWAKSLGSGRYELQHDSLDAVRLHFHQQGWSRVNCSLYVYVDSAPPGPTPTGPLLGVLKYRGGFVSKLPVNVGWVSLTGFRLAVPTFCGKLDLISAGTVVDSVYYSATKVGADRFRTHLEGSQGVDRLLVTMNGPLDLQCDIPIYGDRTN